MNDIIPFAGVVLLALVVTVLAWVVGLALAGRLWRVDAEHRRRLTRAGVPISLALLGLAIASYTAMPWVLLMVITLAVLVNAVLTIRRRAESGVPRAAGVFVSAGVIAAAVSVPFGLATRAVAVEANVASSSCMAPALAPNDHFVVDKFASVQRWDIVTYRPAKASRETWMSRVVALPGETVEIDAGGRLLINGTPAALPSELAAQRYSFEPNCGVPCVGGPGAPVTLGAGEYFVLGDNSAGSYDSRYRPSVEGRQRGAIPRGSIIGVARAVYAPVERARWVR